MKKILFLLLVLTVSSFVVACSSTDASPDAGQNLAVLKGCISCHSVDNTTKIAPTWKGLYGSQVELNNDSHILADDAYLLESIKEPNAKIVKGFTKGAMPHISLTEEEINALVIYIKSVK